MSENSVSIGVGCCESVTLAMTHTHCVCERVWRRGLDVIPEQLVTGTRNWGIFNKHFKIWIRGEDTE